MSERQGRCLAFGDEAQAAILRGAGMVARTVATTLGPAGRAVLIGRAHAAPLLSRQGHAIAKTIELSDPLANLGARALREVAWRMDDELGDGTTTAIVLTHALLREGVRAARVELNPRAFQAGMELAVATALRALEGGARPAAGERELAQIATHASGGDARLGTLLAEAAERVGAEGVVLVEAGEGLASELEVREGMHYDQGYVSSHFTTDEAASRVELPDPYLLLCLTPITTLGAIVPALNAFASAEKPLVIIAPDVSGEALSTLVVNRLRANFQVAAAHAPGAGACRRPMLEDVAIATGGEIVGDERGHTLDDLRPRMLGRAGRVLITRDATTIERGAGDPQAIEQRRRELRAAIAREVYLSYDREQLQKRLARLAGGVGVVKVGGVTESELASGRERASGAARAVRAAATGGILPGGGAALAHASNALAALPAEGLAQRAAVAAVRRALLAPARQIAANLGLDGGAVVARLLASDDGAFGFDAATSRHGDLLEAGVVDAAPVVCAALRNAASTAARLLGTEAAIAPRRAAG